MKQENNHLEKNEDSSPNNEVSNSALTTGAEVGAPDVPPKKKVKRENTGGEKVKDFIDISSVAAD